MVKWNAKRPLAALLAISLALPPQALAGFIPSVVDRSEENLQNMAETRTILENKILTTYLQARGQSPEKIQQTLGSLTPEQRREIFLNDIPAYEANQGGANAALLLVALPLLFFMAWGSGSSKDDHHDRKKNTSSRHAHKR